PHSAGELLGPLEYGIGYGDCRFHTISITKRKAWPLYRPVLDALAIETIVPDPAERRDRGPHHLRRAGGRRIHRRVPRALQPRDRAPRGPRLRRGGPGLHGDPAARASRGRAATLDSTRLLAKAALREALTGG